MKCQKARIAFVVLCIFLAGICYSISRYHGSRTKGQDLSEEISIKENQFDSSDYQEEPQKVSKNAGDVHSSSCYVHICGEVVSPGVYELKEGSRVFQAVEKAGGFTEEAAKDYLNMAETIKDGMKIEVLSDEEAEEAKSTGTNKSKVNVNTATKDELMTLRGVGEAKADDIIRYRESHGGFQKIEDIMKISGIKEAAFEKLKENITV